MWSAYWGWRHCSPNLLITSHSHFMCLLNSMGDNYWDKSWINDQGKEQWPLPATPSRAYPRGMNETTASQFPHTHPRPEAPRRFYYGQSYPKPPGDLEESTGIHTPLSSKVINQGDQSSYYLKALWLDSNLRPNPAWTLRTQDWSSPRTACFHTCWLLTLKKKKRKPHFHQKLLFAMTSKKANSFVQSKSEY